MNGFPEVMIDLETLGLRPGHIVMAIGAVAFDLRAGTICEQTFYRKIHMVDSQRYGLTIDAGTVLWWFQQSKAAQLAASTSGQLVTEVLNDFSAFFAGSERPWGNSPSVDCAMLSAVYDAAHMKQPWDWWNERDFRTLRAWHPAVERDAVEGEKHDALDDAMAQVKHLMKIRSYVLQQRTQRPA